MEFDTQYGLYRDGFLYFTHGEIRAEIDRLRAHFIRQSRSIARQLFNGEISIADFQIALRDLLKESTIISSSIGYGGLEQMTPERWGTVGAYLRKQYAFLNEFGRQIEQGKVIVEAQFTRRAQLYADSLRAIYFRGEVETAKLAGYRQSRRILNALESCRQCREWAQKGFVELELQPPIGSLICGQFCRCELEYR